jgi:ABC-type nitrate/sulfonate/bicarbonate transport system, permease component
MSKTSHTHTDAAPLRDEEFVAQIRRSRRRDKTSLLAARGGVLVLLIVAWEVLAGKAGEPMVLVDKYFVSQPSDLLRRVADWIEQGILLPNIGSTLLSMSLGFAVGVLGGVVAGFAIGWNSRAAAVLTPFVSAIYSIPRLALVPLFLLWFGLGLGSKVAFTAMLVGFLVFYSTYAGVRDVDRDLIDTLRVLHASRLQRAVKIMLPSAMVWIVAGLRTSAPYALVGAVTAEMMSSNSGLGYLLQRAAGQFDTAGMFGSIFVMMMMALVLNGGINLIERATLRWKVASNST